jgi:hypothetical protein
MGGIDGAGSLGVRRGGRSGLTGGGEDGGNGDRGVAGGVSARRAVAVTIVSAST